MTAYIHSIHTYIHMYIRSYCSLEKIFAAGNIHEKYVICGKRQNLFNADFNTVISCIHKYVLCKWHEISAPSFDNPMKPTQLGIFSNQSPLEDIDLCTYPDQIHCMQGSD